MSDVVSYAETMPDIFGQVVFCDDIRFEQQGKLTAVGIYTGAMFVHTGFPLTMKSFAVLVNYQERAGTQKDDVIIEVLFPGHELPFAKLEVPLAELRNNRAAGVIPGIKPNFNSLTFPLVAGPVVIPSAGLIVVVAKLGDRVQRLGALTVVQTPSQPPEAEAAN